MKLLLIADDGTQTEARCDACRHWSRYAEGSAEHHREIGFCDGVRPWCSNELAPFPSERAAVGNPEPHDGGSLWTAADFGCAEFEPKEKA